uniref:Tc1-like transposase DDE domain-containing protein n=1 Tax=Seriola lalandi dorsalis TaxID=1841481 RepID=A0A3B4YAJ7_SERLL
MWKKVIWSDEQSFIILSTSGRVHVWCTPRERYRPECLIPAVRGSGGSVMLGEALFWEGALQINTNGLFQENDDDAIRRARGVTEWFDEYENNVNHMLWPPESPDLNPVNHLCQILDQHVRQHSTLPSSKHQMREYLLEELYSPIR